jgi:phenylpyruvate tautomerase PptA (4-oxalocrotonate tautomerase family)
LKREHIKGEHMPFIRVNCPKGALTADQKSKLAPLLVEAPISQEIDLVTEIGRAATGFMFNEIAVDNCFPNGVPWLRIRRKRS